MEAPPMRFAVLLLAAATLLAGCVQPPEPVDPESASQLLPFVDPIVDDHDHASYAEHNLSTPSMHLIAHTTMSAEEPTKAFSYIGEMDTLGNYTVVQILGRGDVPGFVVLDVSDPAAPTPIGRAEMPFSYVVDVKWSPDGRYVFAASQAGPTRSGAHAPVTDDPANGLLQGNGFTQWDMSDPTAPVAIAGGLAEPSGCHMLSVKEIGGTLTVFCVARTVQVFQYVDGGAWSQVATLEPDTAGLPRVLDETLASGPGAASTLQLSASPHDITIMPDPLDERLLVAAVSYWDLGVMFYDVSDPRQPTMLGAWSGAGADVYEGNVHGAMLTLHEGKRIAVVGPELLGQTIPAMWVLDLSDFAAPALIAEWVPPGEHVTQGLLLTVHQFQLVDGRIYLAYNHAGVWVLDLATIIAGPAADATLHPEVLGYYLPHAEVELYAPDAAAVPNTWDLNVKDGFILASDRYTGFYVLHYAEDAAGDATLTSWA